MLKKLGVFGLGLVLLTGIAGVPSLSAENLAFNLWDVFNFGQARSEATPEYDFTLTSAGQLRVVDCCIIGDEFEIDVNGNPYYTSAIAAADDGVTPPGAFTGDGAWADGRLSRLSLSLAPGVYHIDEWVTRNSQGAPGGSGFIRVDTVPEPATMLLLGLGLIGIAGVRRRFKK